MKEPDTKSKTAAPRKRSNPWTLRVVVILIFWVLIYFFVAGPGRVLFPSLLISYKSVSDNKNTVYYYGNRIEKALDILWIASVTQDSIERFWGDTVGQVFQRGVTIFLCESPSQYLHLTWNKAIASAIMGRIVLNEPRISKTMSLYSAMVHEMSRLYVVRKQGYLPAVLLYPKWFDEGCAVLMQDYSAPEDKLEENLWQDPTLVSVTSLTHPWQWQAMTRMQNGRMAARGYGQVCLLTRYLIDRFGKEKLQEFESTLGWNLAPGRSFERVYQLPLAQVESEWLQTLVESQEAPPETAFVPLPFDFLVFLRWLAMGIVIVVPLTLLIRWLIRLLSRVWKRTS